MIKAPITLVLDNARYQKCKIVTALALQLDIELLYLPAYSPHLNLIERLWKFVKKKVLYSKYYPNFTEFRNAITDCLNQTSPFKLHKNNIQDQLLTNVAGCSSELAWALSQDTCLCNQAVATGARTTP